MAGIRTYAAKARTPIYRWDPQHLYLTLQFLFGKPGRASKDGTPRLIYPADNPLPLAKAEFRIAHSEYRRHRVRAWIDKWRASGKRRQRAEVQPRPWPANPFRELKQSAEFWEYERADFADSRWGQSKARKLLAPYTGRGANHQRAAVAKLLRATAVGAKAHVANSNALEFFAQLADQEFLCWLLRAEAVERAGSSSRSRLDAEAAQLCREYAYILKLREFAGMTPADLRDCILQSKQAIANVGRRFRIEPASVRPILAKLIS